MAELLIEIGIEELPAGWLEGVAGQLGRAFEDLARREYLEPESVAVYWTPRRLVLRADLAVRQADREERLWGPPAKLARDQAGEWTKAAHGFAKKCACALESLKAAARSAEGTDEYLYFDRRIRGRATKEVLPSILAGALRALAFPKRMSWDAWLDDGKGAFSFGRPIRWLVVLLAGRVVPFAIYELASRERGRVLVKAGSQTWGHRFLPRGRGRLPIAVRSFADLKKKLSGRLVVIDPRERAEAVSQALARHVRQIPDDHGLPREWRDLVERPTVVVGKIPVEFQQLPTEVLETVLVHHQKYIPLLHEGRGVARFAALIGGDGASAQEIVRGMERVVVARLRDAAFFYQEDMKRPLGERVADLAGVTFHKGLGSYLDKVERMAALVDAMGPELGLLTKPEHEGARTAARLCKADLTTLMVRELPELQGVMGGIYLRAQGVERADVADAVQWHYHPTSIERDSPPAGRVAGDARVFAAVSLADKLDSLAGYFGLGLIPSGSSDPFGLRRAAHGVLRVLVDFWRSDGAERKPDLRRLVAHAVSAHADFGGRTRAQIAADLEAFLVERLRYLLVARGSAADEVEAVLGAREPDALEDPQEVVLRLEALHRVRAEARDDFEHLAVAFKRAKNIVTESAGRRVDPARLQDEAERVLHDMVVHLSAGGGGYESRLRALATLRAPVDRFFDEVLVMSDDEQIRANRQALLSLALSLFYRIADVSRLG